MPPGPDGQWTANEIQKLDPAISIILVTGYRSTSTSSDQAVSNFSDNLLYLQKPFYRQEIVQFSTALSIKWKAERQLMNLHSELESLVETRTAELLESNKLLKSEIENRKQIQLELEQSFANLKKVTDATIQAIALIVEKRDPLHLRASKAGSRTDPGPCRDNWAFGRPDRRGPTWRRLFMISAKYHCRPKFFLNRYNYPK